MSKAVREIKLRDYQLAAVQGLRDGIRAGHRSQVLVAPTGSGKTVMAAHLLQEAVRRGTRAAFLVDRISLVDQTSALLDDYGIDHGVIQSGHWRKRLAEPIQVCSSQTLEKRGFFPGLDLLVVDECHSTRKQTTEFIKNTNARVIGLTATPFTAGMADLFTNLVNVTTTNKLVAEGFLVMPIMYAAKAIDMTGAKVVAGEWAEKEIERRGKKIVGDIVSEWVDKSNLHFGGPVKTIVFTATVDSGDELCRQFNAAGFNFQQISYRDGSDNHRREVIEEFRKSDSSIHGLVSCEVFTKGFDVPDIKIGIAARPYRKSFSSHIQQLGRVMRSYPGKDKAIWLDHCGNAQLFYADTNELFENGVQSLNDESKDKAARKEPDEKEKAQMKCSACGYLLAPHMTVCPGCGKERTKRSLVETVAGEMVVLGAQPESTLPAYLRDRKSVWRQLCTMAITRKGGLDEHAANKWALAQYRNLYSEWPRDKFRPIAPYSEWPRSDVNPHSVPFIDPQLAGKIRANMIAWAKRAAA